jgi:CDGSH iron-sulfur domain-containing protein 3
MNQPECPQNGPYRVELEEGKTYFWCSCGLSAKQPFCDGAHKGSGFSCIKWVCEKTETVSLCGCKKTKNGPRCDGSHK